jgi:ArsR family metal-binding transcriptional regulator
VVKHSDHAKEVLANLKRIDEAQKKEEQKHPKDKTNLG